MALHGLQARDPGRRTVPVRVHEPWTWKQVAGELPDSLARRIALAMLLIVTLESGFQSGRREKKRNGTGG